MYSSYLQWVGTNHYATIDDFVKEAAQRGVSKKLPNPLLVQRIALNPTVIFLAHDQGRTKMCLACAEAITCPRCHGVAGDVPCPRCRQLGAIEIGTGGYAVVDGERWHYTRYIRLRRNIGHEFWKEEHDLGEVKSCDVCAGRGSIPEGAIFALYAPDRINYIHSRGKPRPPVLSKPGVRIRVVSADSARKWPRRGNERFKPGSFYAVTVKRKRPAKELVEYVEVQLGKDAVVYHGNFAVLRDFLSYQGKQFRGLKCWTPPERTDVGRTSGSILEGVV